MERKGKPKCTGILDHAEKRIKEKTFHMSQPVTSRRGRGRKRGKEEERKEKKTTSYIRERKSKFQIYLTPQQGFSRKGTNK